MSQSTMVSKKFHRNKTLESTNNWGGMQIRESINIWKESGVLFTDAKYYLRSLPRCSGSQLKKMANSLRLVINKNVSKRGKGIHKSKRVMDNIPDIIKDSNTEMYISKSVTEKRIREYNKFVSWMMSRQEWNKGIPARPDFEFCINLNLLVFQI